eukprot:TRINITY_DN382_c1_g1_i1.p4 TRINITY_DN382_c1_g1~~TRINITY_DN382_c1_g1_i1.p4  ORF type:complete len:132 (+),score=13.32 TRINITY_DN382_c1_g1_i1:54-449(+)
MYSIGCLLLLVSQLLLVNSQIYDPIAINYGAPESEEPQESQNGCALDTLSASVCPEVWKPVCGAEQVTYWNCCFHAVYSNSTAYTVGKCEGDAPIFLTDDVQEMSNITVNQLPVLDYSASSGSRKLLTLQG